MAIERASSGIEAGADLRERLASLLTLSLEPMLAWRLDGPIEFWNTGAERLYGFVSDEAVGRSSHDLLQTKFPVEFSELHLQLQNEHYWSGELRHICKGGQEVIVDSRMQLLDDGTVLEVNRDITQRKQLEAAIRESEPRMRFLASTVENSDDAIVSKTLDGIITSWNNGAEQIFGYAAEEAIGQPITIVIPKDRQNEEREILTHIRRGEGIVHFETVRQRKQGSLVAVSSDCRVGLAPTGKRRLCTAHTHSGRQARTAHRVLCYLTRGPGLSPPSVRRLTRHNICVVIWNAHFVVVSVRVAHHVEGVERHAAKIHKGRQAEHSLDGEALNLRGLARP